MISVGLPTMLWRVKLRLRDEGCYRCRALPKHGRPLMGRSMIELEIARFETCRARLGPSAIAFGPFSLITSSAAVDRPQFPLSSLPASCGAGSSHRSPLAGPARRARWRGDRITRDVAYWALSGYRKRSSEFRLLGKSGHRTFAVSKRSLLSNTRPISHFLTTWLFL